MNIIHIISTGALAVLLVAGTSVIPASALPDPGEPDQPGTPLYHPGVDVLYYYTGPRLLARIGTQYVRGDDLTGAGVPAPDWVLVAG
ncbi:hypothetical protein [Agromyces bauzanensis]